VCVHCGVQYEYDWQRMTRLRRVPPEGTTGLVANYCEITIWDVLRISTVEPVTLGRGRMKPKL